MPTFLSVAHVCVLGISAARVDESVLLYRCQQDEVTLILIT